MNDFKGKVDFFIKNSKNFYGDSSLDNIDKKHVNIVAKAYALIESSFSISKIRDWDGQSDHIPNLKYSKL